MKDINNYYFGIFVPQFQLWILFYKINILKSYRKPLKAVTKHSGLYFKTNLSACVWEHVVSTGFEFGLQGYVDIINVKGLCWGVM